MLPNPIYFAWELVEGGLRPRLFLAGIPAATYSRLLVVHNVEETAYNSALSEARKRQHDNHAIVNVLAERYPAPQVTT